jgi:hypothetical protein
MTGSISHKTAGALSVDALAFARTGRFSKLEGFLARLAAGLHLFQ